MSSREPDVPLGDIVNLFPEELGNPGIRQRLRDFTDALDEMLFVDASGEPMVDRNALLRIVQDEKLIPSEQQDLIFRETERYLGQKIKERIQDSRLAWRDAAQYKIPIAPESTATLNELGINESLSVDGLRRILSERYPDIPSFWLKADADAIRHTTLRALAHNQTVWDCLVRRLGLWATLAVFAALGGALIVGTATGPWGVPLAIWLIAVLGGGTAVIVLNCILDPAS